MKRSLPRSVVKRIHAACDSVFDKAMAKLLARPPVDKKIHILVKPRVTLPSLFEAASAEERAKADKNTLETLLDIAQGFIDAQRHSTKAHVVKSVESWLNRAAEEGVDTDVETVLGGELAGVWQKATDGMHKIVAAESNAAKNTGLLDGLVRVNIASGIDDPVVYFVVVRDDSLCEECKRLHLMDDGRTPRLWYLSEVGHGYHKKGDSNPKLNGLHPHCRCTPATMLPGFGFDDAGMVTYVKPDHLEIEEQRGVKKSERPLDETPEPAQITVPDEVVVELKKELGPLLDQDGLVVVGDKAAFDLFKAEKYPGVFVAFRGQETGVEQSALTKMVREAATKVCPTARVFAKHRNYKIFVQDRSQADAVIAGIQAAVLGGE